MGDVDTKTYADETFYGKPLPPLANLEFLQGDKAAVQATGAVQIIYFFNTYYKGAFNCNEELTVLADKFKEVQVVAIGNDAEKVAVEKLLASIANGSCCDPITKQVFRLNVPFVAFDAGKHATKAFADALNTSVLHVPQAFIVDKTGKLVWRQALLQNCKFSDTNFEAQLVAVLAGNAVAQTNGNRPKGAEEAAEAGMADDMSLW